MYYFIGIKGTGMAALAVMLHDLGKDVCGSDLSKHFFTEDELVKRNIPIYDFNPDNIKDGYTVIIGNAFLEDFAEVKAARNNPSCTCYRYHEFLGKLIEDYVSIGICGSHGKTTTTTMCETVFSRFKNTGYLIGDGEGFLDKTSEYICIEACEFRRHFLAYKLDYAIITNIEIDHVDYFKDETDYFNAYQELVRQIKKAVVYNGDDLWCQKLEFGNLDHYSYGLRSNNDFYPANIESDEKHTVFELKHEDKTLGIFDIPFVGNHLLMDALGVIVMSYIHGFDLKEVNEAFNSYHGPKRRYVVEEYKDSVFIDDYAHHPTEVNVTLEATRKRYPDRNIVAIFKPHRASRVKYFAEQFRDALKLADNIYLLEFTSIDDKQDGTDVNIDYLANMIEGSAVLPENEEGARILAAHHGSVYVFMSSKDIYNIANMVKSFLN